MRNLITILAVLVVIAFAVGCKKQAEGISASQADTIPGYYVPQEDTLKTANWMRVRIDTIFKQIYAKNMTCAEADKQFTSNEFFNAITECGKRAAANGASVLPGNHWTQSLDSGAYKMTIQSVSYEEPADSGTAVVEISTAVNRSTPCIVTLKMVWERDNWYVDNFIDRSATAITDEKATLKHYLSTGQILRPKPVPVAPAANATRRPAR